MKCSPNILGSSQFLGNIPQKYVKEVPTIVLEHSPFFGNIPQSIWGKFNNFAVICVTNILGKMPQNFFTVYTSEFYSTLIHFWTFNVSQIITVTLNNF